jgi:OmpA-OmpF porin, OOP family
MSKVMRLSVAVATGAAVLLLAGCQCPPGREVRPLMLAPAPAPMPPAPMVEHRHETLSADALFAFGRSDIDSLTPRGHEQLARLVDELHDSRIHAVSLVGYTDRIGNRAANDDLSLRRANAVRDYLVAHGVDAGLISTEGHGDADPVANCPGLTGAQLRDCLAPNRRVEVNIDVIR